LPSNLQTVQLSSKKLRAPYVSREARRLRTSLQDIDLSRVARAHRIGILSFSLAHLLSAFATRLNSGRYTVYTPIALQAELGTPCVIGSCSRLMPVVLELKNSSNILTYAKGIQKQLLQSTKHIKALIHTSLSLPEPTCIINVDQNV